MVKRLGILLVLMMLGCSPQESPQQKSRSAEETVKAHLDFIGFVSEGIALARDGKHEAALEAYRQAAKAKPELPVGWNNICFQLIQLKQYAEAVENCEKALEIEPNFELAKNNLKTARDRLGASILSTAQLKQQLMSSTDPPADKAIEVGLRLYQEKDFKAAIAVWELVKGEAPQYPLAQNNIATARILRGEFQLAEQALQKALAREPKNQLFLNNKRWLQEAREK